MLTIMETHEVFNQSPDFADINFYSTDRALQSAIIANDGNADGLEAFGALAGKADTLELGRLANEFVPQLKLFDSKGNRLDRVDFHPSYHQIMAISTGHNLHNGSHTGVGNVNRAAIHYLATQMEASHCCPTTMTNAAIPVIKQSAEISDKWLEKLSNKKYDSGFCPIEQKTAATIGMGMTEKQGGTDVRANTTRAEPVGGDEFVLTGHKWFMSAPMSDAFLVLAQAPGGLTCFFLPRFLPDGQRNRIFIQQLKDKMGNRANASCEVEFEKAHAWQIGEQGRGVATIIEMVTYTRLDCAVASAGLMRSAIAQAIFHTRHRTVFQKKLIDQPLMQTVLGDMALDLEAGVALGFRLARSFDLQDHDETEALFARFMTPVIKYLVCKSLPKIANEAMECLGGNGYVEESPMARLYREAPLNAIWEGSGNVMCLDFLRAVVKDRDGFFSLLDSLQLDNASTSAITDMLGQQKDVEAGSRSIIELLGHATAARLLQQTAPDFIGDAYIESRLNGRFANTFGHMNHSHARKLIERTLPG